MNYKTSLLVLIIIAAYLVSLLIQMHKLNLLVQTCVCHKTEKQGQQLKIWSESNTKLIKHS